MALPALRQLDIIPIDEDGETLFCLRDPEGYVEDQLVLSPPAFFVAASLDGCLGLEEIQQSFSDQFDGVKVRAEDVLKVVEYLDDHGFLLTDRFEALRQSVIDRFRASPIRPAYLAGKSYPSGPDELVDFLDGQFQREGGPGELPAADMASNRAPLPGLIVPHIDLDRGGHSYAHGYLRMAREGRPDTVLLFGVAHTGPAVPFILTRKDFATPLGLLETDQGIVDRLAAVCGWDPFEHEEVHRTEHSIEFQVLMLTRLYGTGVRIVPVLCGFIAREPAFSSPERIAETDRFLDVCRAVASEPGRRVSVVAGADLAHVGRRFGHDIDVDARVVAGVEARDREDLEHVLRLDAEGFYASVMRDGNARQVCGLGCIYAALKSIAPDNRRGELLHYGYAPDPAGGIVSFAGLAVSARS